MCVFMPEFETTGLNDGIQASVHANSSRHVTMLIAATGFVLGKFAALRRAVVLAYCYSFWLSC